MPGTPSTRTRSALTARRFWPAGRRLRRRQRVVLGGCDTSTCALARCSRRDLVAFLCCAVASQPETPTKKALARAAGLLLLLGAAAVSVGLVLSRLSGAQLGDPAAVVAAAGPHAEPHAAAPVAPAVHAETGALYAVPAEAARGLLVLLHGCSNVPDFFFWHPADVRIVRAALQRGLAVVAVGAQDQRSHWDPTPDGADLARVSDAVAAVERSLGLAGLPRVAAGFSSGGMFASSLATLLPLDGLLVEIAPVVPWFGRPPGLMPARVAVLFMARDTSFGTREAAEAAAAAARARGSAASVWEARPHPLTPSTFAAALPSVDQTRSEQLFEAAVALGVASEAGDVASEPDSSALRQLAASGLLVSAREVEAASQVFSTLHGRHSMTAEHIGAILDFLLPG
eukprot:TRINITY_DN138_c0_g1_i3.p1 TRINITY_DN138_c0_g1~~TRINITY_DN138_c0_g1_i3.p1  ORF type:complete len:399 (-),score=78.93 TRINITY_DN138_c0_g1_i3:262-1458(-)